MGYILQCTVLLVSWTRTDFSDRAFSAARPRVWNHLPTDLGQSDLSCSRFRHSLKTFSFEQWDQSTGCTWSVFLLAVL